MGGYSQLIRDRIEEQMERLALNPRCFTRLGELRRELLNRIPEMRQTIQALVSRSEFSPRNAPSTRSDGQHPAVLADGSYPEFEIRSDDLAFAGRVDLVTVTASEVHITDYKSGTPSPHHEDQLRVYAALWAHRSMADPDRPVATRLTASYATHDLNVDAPSVAEVGALAATLRSRTTAAASSVASGHPTAIPTPDNCRFCSVRHLCDDYWEQLPSARPDGRCDLEVEVLARNGPRSWSVRGSGGDGVMRTDEGLDLQEGIMVRVLGAFVFSPDSPGEPWVASLGAGSEIYSLRADR
jgi:hypothetical protein